MIYEPTNPELIATAFGMALINRTLIEATDRTNDTDVTQTLVSVHEHAALAGGSLLLLAKRLGCDAEVRKLVAEGQARLNGYQASAGLEGRA